MKKVISLSFLFLVFFTSVAWFFLRGDEENQAPRENTTSENKQTIIAFGDSLTAGYGLPLFESYPAQLEARLARDGYAVTVVNAGVSGETSRGNRERASFIRAQNPDIVILGIGGNDALRNLSIAELRENIATTIRTLQSGQNPPQVLLLQMQAPLNLGLAYKRDFDAVYTSLAKEFDITLVPFLQPEVFRDANLLLPDGIHPNKDGYAKLLDTYVYDAVIQVLQEL